MQKHYFVKKAMCMVQLILGQSYLFCLAGIRLLHKERKIYILEKPMFAAVENKSTLLEASFGTACMVPVHFSN
jgi:hypothetical protein